MHVDSSLFLSGAPRYPHASCSKQHGCQSSQHRTTEDNSRCQGKLKPRETLPESGVLGRPWKPASLLLEVAYRAHRSVRTLNHLPVLVLVRIRTDCGFRDCERLSEGRTSIPG